MKTWHVSFYTVLRKFSTCLHDFCCLLIFFKIKFFEKFLQEYHQSVVSNSLGTDQARKSVGPDLDPNCLQRLFVIRKRI